MGIALHYSSLSTLLWLGVSSRVLYKEAVWRTPRQPEAEPSVPPTQRPMLRSVGPIRAGQWIRATFLQAAALEKPAVGREQWPAFRQMSVTLAPGEATQKES